MIYQDYTIYDEPTQNRLLRRWFSMNAYKGDGQSSIYDLVDSVREELFWDISKERLAQFLNEREIVVENDVVVGVRLWGKTE
jgi:hypothetical protein